MATAANKTPYKNSGFRKQLQLTETLRHRYGSSKIIRLVIVAAVLLLLLIITPRLVRAEESRRHLTIEREVVKTYWYVSRWKDGPSKILCQLTTLNDRQPVADDLAKYCGQSIRDEWLKTPLCVQAAKGGNSQACAGLYYWFGGSVKSVQKETMVLPSATVRIEPGTCQPGNWCNERPTLRLFGAEPLAEYKITQVVVRMGDSERRCEASACEMNLPVTRDGVGLLEIWAVSDYGDESQHQFLPYRMYLNQEENPRYWLDLISRPWQDRLPSGALQWNLLPRVDDPILNSVTQPQNVANLATREPFQYLAGKLIMTGRVDASSCQSSLLANKNANECGMEVARDQVIEWQNQYDSLILESAEKNKVPARILKAIIAKETQFWPYDNVNNEYGFGKITENGSDMLLFWNPSYYSQICNASFKPEFCITSYGLQSESDKALLRGAALRNVGTKEEFDLIGATLSASINQVTKMMSNTTETTYFNNTTYSDLWKMTIANYHSGSGCLSTAMNATKDNSQPLIWENIHPYLLGGCQGAVGYVEDVLKLSTSNLNP